MKMVWFCGGHGVCLTKGGASKLPLEQTWTWLDKYLKGNTAADTGPGFTWIDQRGKYRSASSYPTPDRTLTAKGKGTLALKKNGGSGPYTGKLPGDVSPTFQLVLRPTIPVRPSERSTSRPAPRSPPSLWGTPKLKITYRARRRTRRCGSWRNWSTNAQTLWSAIRSRRLRCV